MKTDKSIFIAFILNVCFSFFEFFGGIFTNSVAIMSDAIHDMGDAFSIGVSYLLERKSKKKPDDKYTFGYIRYSVMGSAITTIVLTTGSLFVIFNSIKRLFNPVSINYSGMIVFAIIGFIVNFIACFFTRDGESLNQRSVNLHMLEDVLGWLVVLIGAFIMRFTDISIIDPIMSIGVAVFILINSLKNFKSVIDLFLEKTPSSIDISDLKKHLLRIDGVSDIHHIHVWSIDGVNNMATLHVVSSLSVKDKIREELRVHGIVHSTIEIDDVCCDNVSCDINYVSNSKSHHH